MPPVPAPIDGLWRCLSPIWNIPHWRGPSLLTPPSKRRPQRRLHPASRQSHTQSYSKATKALQCMTYLPGCTETRRSIHIQKVPSISSYYPPSKLPNKREFPRQSRPPDLYEQLGSLASKADYHRVWAWASRLVKEHGEKPNLRIYDALILANAHNEYGSLEEVKRLLAEMVNEGINPDSGTYHAVLRVRKNAR